MAQSIARRYTILGILALSGIAAYLLIPPRSQRSIYHPDADLPRALYTLSDSAVGGKSSTKLLDSAGTLYAELSLSAPAGRSPWTGFGIDLRLLRGGYDNWTLYDTLYMDLRTEGLQEITVKVLTHDPDFTTGERAIYRTLIKEIPTTSEWTTVPMLVDHLYVPDWWYSDNGISKEFDLKRLETTARLEFLPGKVLNGHGPIRIELRRVEAVGRSNLYFGILVAYLLLIIIVAFGAPSNTKKRR